MEHLISFAHSVQGANHIKANKECQDSSGSYTDDLMSVVAVADGHGSENYPRTGKGASFAVTAAIDVIKEFVVTAKQCGIDIYEEQEERFRNLALNILKQWHSSVQKDLKNRPFQLSELEKVSDNYKKRYNSGERCEKAYGTTLVAVCATADCWFGLHIGDGKCVAVDQYGECFEPIPWDENCQANITTSICDSDAIDEFRFFCDKGFPLGIFIGSDGIDDSYAGDGELHDLYRTILCLFAEYGETVGNSEVKDFLPKISRNGSGDDVSVAGLIHFPRSKGKIAWIKAQKEYETAYREFQSLEKEAIAAENKAAYFKSEIEKAKQTYEGARLKTSGLASGEAADRLRDVMRKAAANLEQAKQRLAQADALRDQTAARKTQAERRLKKADEELRFFRRKSVASKRPALRKKMCRKGSRRPAKRKNNRLYWS